MTGRIMHDKSRQKYNKRGW